MRIIRKPVDVIAIFKRGELPVPVRVRMEIDGKEIVTKVDRIIRAQNRRLLEKGRYFTFVRAGLTERTEYMS